VDLLGHEAGNGGHSQRKPTAPGPPLLGVQALSHDVSHKSALQPEQAISGAPKIGPASEHVVERSLGYGLGL